MDAALIAQTSEQEGDQIGTGLNRATEAALRAGQVVEARALITGQMQMGLSAHQAPTAGIINLNPKAAEGLARAVAVADEEELDELSELALAGWAMVMAYGQTHFNLMIHPMFVPTIGRLGEEPPWEEAATLVADDEFLSRWHTKMDFGPAPVLATLVIARDAVASGDPAGFIDAQLAQAEADGQSQAAS